MCLSVTRDTKSIINPIIKKETIQWNAKNNRNSLECESNLTYVCMYVCVYVCMRVCTCMHVCMYACMYTYVCMYVCMCVCIILCISLLQ